MRHRSAARRAPGPGFPGAGKRRREFEEQALPHLRPLYSRALRLSRNERDAEDLVQDTYLRAYRFFNRFEPGTNIRAWLYRILQNQFLNHLHHEKPVSGAADFETLAESGGISESAFPHSPLRTPEEEVMNSVTAAEIEEALALLPREYRQVVIMAFTEEMSYREIADALGIPIGTVMSRLHRGRKILRKQLFDFAAHRHLVGTKALASAAGDALG
ncbi:MAG TPA: sigma-70 family RNA polymerase sigma factor [Candidatus Polarisedimenticolia bacterium]|nr:sigma-70 family RNA polymerase sigma factor [Candidatus Polarisedimenticolia bacterium]